MPACDLLTLDLIGPAARDFFLTAAAVTGSIVAVVGLRTWRKQLKVQTEYELARRLYRGLLRVRDRIRAARSPFLPSEYDEMRKAYEERVEELSSAWREVEPDLLEGEALWGAEVPTIVQSLRRVQGELISNIGQYLWVQNPNPPAWQTVDRSPERVERLESVVLAGRDTEDAFDRRLVEAMEGVERMLRPKLAVVTPHNQAPAPDGYAAGEAQ